MRNTHITITANVVPTARTPERYEALAKRLYDALADCGDDIDVQVKAYEVVRSGPETFTFKSPAPPQPITGVVCDDGYTYRLPYNLIGSVNIGDVVVVPCPRGLRQRFVNVIDTGVPSFYSRVVIRKARPLIAVKFQGSEQRYTYEEPAGVPRFYRGQSVLGGRGTVEKIYVPAPSNPSRDLKELTV